MVAFDRLTEDQATRAVQATFVGQSEMHITLRTGKCGARKFMMVAAPIIECGDFPAGLPDPTPISPPALQGAGGYCFLCWISGSWSWPPFLCSTEPVWWAKMCNA